MDIEEKISLIKRNAEELISEDELRELLSKNENPSAYIGFEPSGLVHLGWVMVASKISDLVNAGMDVTVYWADWHAYINDKLGGGIDNIKVCAGYMEDCFEALGISRDKVKYVYASELLDSIKYWETVIKIAKVTSLSRVKRAMTIMGRSEDEAEVDSSKLFYPILQAADIFRMDIDLAYAGMDQRKAHMLARDAAEKLGWRKPIALHTPLLPGLKGGDRMNPAASKMSKSDPDSGVNIHDTDDDIKRKMGKAFCPPERESEQENPVLMLCRHIVLPRTGTVNIDRPEKFGGPVSFTDYNDIAEAYFSGKLHPMDLKKGVTDGLIRTLGPVREYFETRPEEFCAIKEILKRLGKI
ncbi:MAG: tyrosine--tRNA ligase [Methanomassiliicoccaceae archaeon]|jgi:tyrosyl-tRNA synthetase|nr:tyrosine--tRNA ligase [Methanomassiliicoccaceae archaeon]